MKYYLCYEDEYTREILDWGKSPYETEEEAEEACSYWKSVDPETYKDMFVYPM